MPDSRKPAYKRVLLKISGEALMGNQSFGINPEVLTLVAQGLANKQIARQLGTADGTIKVHVEHILAKLGAADRTHAVTIALRRGIIHLDSKSWK